MKLLASLAIGCVLFLLGLLGASGFAEAVLFGIAIPYLAAVILVGGLAWRVFRWWSVPVPFHIPTTCGQQLSLPWIKSAKLDNPSSRLGVAGRLALEIFCFRSLLRNTKTRVREVQEGTWLVYNTSLWLWLAAMAFHGSLLIVLMRHLRFFINPMPPCVAFLESVDGFFDVGMPVYYISSVVFLLTVIFLLVRRVIDARLRYISLAEDYFLLVLILGIGLSGFCLRHDAKTDLVAIQSLAMGLITLRPTMPQPSISPLFFGHLFLVCVLAAYIPFSKIVHLAAVLLSPTRNLANNSRRVRHVNPWRHAVKVHTYEEYENELRDKMKAAGIPIERQQ